MARYTEQALPGRPGRSSLRRQTYRALSDLRTELQRTMAEPRSASRPAARLWPAVLALENLMDTLIAAGVRIQMSGQRPDETAVARPAAEPRELAGAVRDGRLRDSRLPPARPLPVSADLQQVADAVAGLRRVLAGERAAA